MTTAMDNPWTLWTDYRDEAPRAEIKRVIPRIGDRSYPAITAPSVTASDLRSHLGLDENEHTVDLDFRPGPGSGPGSCGRHPVVVPRVLPSPAPPAPPAAAVTPTSAPVATDGTLAHLTSTLAQVLLHSSERQTAMMTKMLQMTEETGRQQVQQGKDLGQMMIEAVAGQRQLELDYRKQIADATADAADAQVELAEKLQMQNAPASAPPNMDAMIGAEVVKTFRERGVEGVLDLANKYGISVGASEKNQFVELLGNFMNQNEPAQSGRRETYDDDDDDDGEFVDDDAETVEATDPPPDAQ